MKILFDHALPFMLAHGGLQTNIEQTKAALERQGVEVEFLRWWDSRQTGDLIHYFQGARNWYLQMAELKHLPVVATHLFSETCNRSPWQLKLQGALTRLILSAPAGEGVKQQLAWRTYHHCTVNIVGIRAEQDVLETVYQVPADKIALVPSGLSNTYLQAGPGPRNEPHLVSTGTITARKHSAELAEMALRTGIPILFTGKPYDVNDPYWHRFQKLIDGRLVKHRIVTYDSPQAGEAEMIKLLQSARGFVLMSDYENWCLSAHEAAACGLPLLVPDQNWSRERFGNSARYFKNVGVSPANLEALKKFYADCPDLPAPTVKQYSWDDVATLLIGVYRRALNRP